jgi:NAD(P)-dependent dehydrogenase (short-subunit alcohol dehydrogenase family)
MIQQSLAGQVVLITGNTGIAAASARLAAAQGAQVFVCGLEREPGESLAAEIAGAAYSGDLSTSQHAEAAVAHCLERFGQIDALFNVAGGSGRKFGDGPLHLITDEGWDRTFDMNLRTMFLVTRSVLRRMMVRKIGSIVHMASVTAYSPEPENFATHAYNTAKGAAIALTKAMSAYYAPHGIRVNAIAPGLVRTPMSRRAQSDDAILRQMRTKQPLAGGLIEPEEVARTAVFLLGPESRMITGQIVGVDAGWEVS